MTQSHVPENFGQINFFSQSCLKKYNHLFVWCLKMKINEFKKSKFCFLEKQADLKINCTSLFHINNNL